MFQLQTKDADDLAISVVAMTQAKHFDAGLPSHEGTSFKDWVGGLDEPGVRAKLFHIASDVEHEIELAEILAMTSSSVVAEPFPEGTFRFLVIMASDEGRINDEVGVAQRGRAVYRLFEPQVGAEFGGVAAGQLVHHLQPALVNVHKADSASPEVFGKAEVSDESEGELGATGADDCQPNCRGHG